MDTLQESQPPAPQPQDAPQELKFRNSGADWALRTIIFVVFLYFGTAKFKSELGTSWVVLFDEIGFGQWLRYVTGALEIAGAFLVLIPGATEIGLALLIAIMFGALMISLFVLRRFSEVYFPVAFMCGMIALLLHRRRV